MTISAELTAGIESRAVAELEREVESLRVRAAINRIVGRDVSAWVNDDDAILDLIVEDVARQWLARVPDDPQMLDGPEGFWSRYANRVEWAPTDSGNQFRPEFCGTSPRDQFDEHSYFYAAWAAHAARLREKR